MMVFHGVLKKYEIGNRKAESKTNFCKVTFWLLSIILQQEFIVSLIKYKMAFDIRNF